MISFEYPLLSMIFVHAPTEVSARYG